MSHTPSPAPGTAVATNLLDDTMTSFLDALHMAAPAIPQLEVYTPCTPQVFLQGIIYMHEYMQTHLPTLYAAVSNMRILAKDHLTIHGPYVPGFAEECKHFLIEMIWCAHSTGQAVEQGRHEHS